MKLLKENAKQTQKPKKIGSRVSVSDTCEGFFDEMAVSFNIQGAQAEADV